MIHDVTIPFSFDTSPIEEHIANIGEREVSKVIEATVLKGIVSVMPKRGTYGYYDKSREDEIDWRRFVNDSFHFWLDTHKAEIVDEAALLLAMKASRKKAWREVLAELKEGA